MKSTDNKPIVVPRIAPRRSFSLRPRNPVNHKATSPALLEKKPTRPEDRLKGLLEERDALLNKCESLEQKISFLEETSRRLSLRSVGTQTAMYQADECSTQTFIPPVSSIPCQTSPKKMPWTEATVKNIDYKKSLFSNKSNLFDSVPIKSLISSIKSDKNRRMKLKSTVATIYCFLENVDVGLAFVTRKKEKFLFSQGLSKILPGKPKFITSDNWAGLPSVTVKDIEFRVVLGENDKKILILEAEYLYRGANVVFEVFDELARTEANLLLGVDTFENFDVEELDILLLVKKCQNLKFCFYNQGSRNIDFLRIENSFIEETVDSMSLEPESRRKSISTWDMHNYFKVIEENEHLKQKTEELSHENLEMRHDLIEREELNAKYEHEIKEIKRSPEDAPHNKEVLSRISTLENILHDLQKQMSNAMTKAEKRTPQHQFIGQQPYTRTKYSKLSNTNWLSDVEMNNYLTYLSNLGNNKDVILVDPIVSSLVKHDIKSATHHLSCLEVQTKTFIVLPVNNNCQEKEGTHWSLLLYDKIHEVFWHFDSLEGTNREHAVQLANNLKLFLGVNGEVEFFEVECPQQSNGYDCGCFALYFAHNIINKITRSLKWSRRWFFFNPFLFVGKIRQKVFQTNSKSITPEGNNRHSPKTVQGGETFLLSGTARTKHL